MRSGFLSLRSGLRSKILLLTALPPTVLAAAVLLTVHRNVSSHVDSTSIHENLEHSATVFESMLAVRLRALAGGAEVIARDPRFFSLVMLGPAQRDPHFVATLKGTANDFNHITQTDLFEVFDRRGQLLASVGARHTERPARANLVREALEGKTITRVMAQGADHFQVALVPVRADRRIVGALMLGATIGAPLARELQAQMRSEVTFFSNGRVSGSTLTNRQDLGALKSWVAARAASGQSPEDSKVERVEAATQTYLTLARPLPKAAGDGQLYVIQRSYDPESAFLRLMQTDMFLIGGLAVVVALVAGWLFSRQITRPVMELVRGARAMENGDFDARIAVANRDELGYLAERFQVMRERERTYVESLEEAARVKSEFISVASHELRTPISVIQGYRDLLADGSLGEISRHQQQALLAIRDCLTQLTRVAENATQVAQIEGERLRLQLVDSDLAQLVDQAIAVARAEAPTRKVTVVRELSPSLGRADVDEARIKEMLSHLVGNGIRFSADGGEVRVTGTGDARGVVLQVRDNGVGFDAARLASLFDRSLIVREPGDPASAGSDEFRPGGLGFGLAIARAVVEAHGGTIDAASEPGVGTLLTVRLPRKASEENREAA